MFQNPSSEGKRTRVRAVRRQSKTELLRTTTFTLHNSSHVKLMVKRTNTLVLIVKDVLAREVPGLWVNLFPQLPPSPSARSDSIETKHRPFPPFPFV